VIDHSAPEARPATVLEKGQVWTMQDRSLEVRHVGKLLVEFTLKKRQEPGSPAKPVRASLKMESIKTVLGFLGANKAVLESPIGGNPD
jgi:hypothetical protein